MKTCKRCKQMLSYSEFYKHSAMKDGYLGFCKECTRARVGKHRVVNLDKIRKYDRLRGRTVSRLKKAAAYSRENRERFAYLSKEWVSRNPLKRRAHIILGNAIKSHKITKLPCQVCGAKKVEGHHKDYNQPLDVEWLCKKHHAFIHRRYE